MDGKDILADIRRRETISAFAQRSQHQSMQFFV
jgi:hypothetical protein